MITYGALILKVMPNENKIIFCFHCILYKILFNDKMNGGENIQVLVLVRLLMQFMNHHIIAK